MGIDLQHEAKVVINGQELTEVQSMVLRVALGSFQIYLAQDEGLGETLRKRYDTHADAIYRLMVKGKAN
jgi:hypothetical protein